MRQIDDEAGGLACEHCGHELLQPRRGQHVDGTRGCDDVNAVDLTFSELLHVPALIS